jgi:peptide/nickel transport system permease protein
MPGFSGTVCLKNGRLLGKAKRGGGGLSGWKRAARHRGLTLGGAIVCLYLGIAGVAPWLVPYEMATRVNLGEALQGPSEKHVLGTDQLGRSMVARLVWGARTSLLVGAGSVMVGAGVGVLLGLVAGYYGGVLSGLVMRGVDGLIAFPRILLALILINNFGPGLWTLVLAVGISSVPVFARLAYTGTVTLKRREFVEAALAIGQSDARILHRYILRNMFSPLLVQVSLSVAASVLTASGLSFLGLGPPPPTPEWGEMLSAARSHVRTSPHLVLVPGGALMLVTLGFNLLGDGLRDVLDPRMRGRG